MFSVLASKLQVSFTVIVVPGFAIYWKSNFNMTHSFIRLQMLESLKAKNQLCSLARRIKCSYPRAFCGSPFPGRKHGLRQFRRGSKF